MDDLDSMKFPQLLDLARQLNVPGRGTARIGDLRRGIRTARGTAAGTVAEAVAVVRPASTPTPAAAVLPGRAAAQLSWRAVATGAGASAPGFGASRVAYRSTDGRYEIRGTATPGGTGRTFTAHDCLSGAKVGHTQRRLMDAKRTVQDHVEAVERAHNDARLMERARRAGDPAWADATHGQVLQALAEDTRRASAGPRELSGLGKLRAAHSAAFAGFVKTTSNCTITDAHCQSCGSTRTEDLTGGDQGYTACCNEPVEAGNFHCAGLHND